MPNPTLSTLIFIIVIALVFDFINGFHDTANAIATSVATRVLSPIQAVSMAGCLNFVGALTGTAKNWKAAGGDDQAIVLVNRAKGSGTRSNMAKFLFAGDDKQFATGESEEDNSETVR